MEAPAHNIELAYQTWRACGQNMVETVRALSKQHGFDVTRQTLAAWREKYDWQGRAARAEAEEREQKSAISDDALIGALLDQKKSYEQYFSSLPFGKVDNQATYGYNSILKSIIDIKQAAEQRRKAGDMETVFADDMRTIKTPQDAIAALQEAIERRINIMLVNPAAAGLKALQEMEKALALVEKMKANYSADDSNTGKKSTDADRQRLVDEVDRLLGVK